MTFRWLLALSLLTTALPLTACSGVKEQLGLTRRMPDEFAVVTRAPLEIPPDINQGALPVPQPGAYRPQEIQPGDAAQAAILSAPVPNAQSESTAESSLLQKAGAGQSNPNIRAIVNKESADGVEDNRPVVKKLLGKIDPKDKGAAAIVNAPAELQRLKNNKQSGQPVTQGDTPTIDD